VNDSGWEVISEPKKKSLEASKAGGSGDARPAHVQNFLECMRSRKQPVENVELGHHVSTVAHLCNIAYRSRGMIAWDAKRECVIGDAKSDALAGVAYRPPWELPYYPRST
jgi:hypothetical protein